MRRSEIWLTAFPESAPAGMPSNIRPALIVSSDRLNETRLGTVVVVPLTTTDRGLPLHVEIESAGLDEVSYAQPELVGPIPRMQLVHRIGVASAAVVRAVDDELRSVLGL